jgi:7-carboxy-7-deazaguanine synthase
VRIAEIYTSIQGEGFLTGTPSVFVRASGCNLRCRYCDTPHASWRPEGDDLSVDEILEQIDERRPYSHVVVTGGEPMLFAELVPLCDRLGDRNLHVTVETAGTLYLPLRCDLMSISPKLTNSTPIALSPRWVQRHEQTRHSPTVIRRLIGEYQCQFKFVVHSRDDADEVLRYLRAFPEIDRRRVMLMPEGTERARLKRTAEWLAAYCVDHQLAFCPRRHIEWFGHKRGT